HGTVKPFHGAPPLGIRLGLIHAVRIIDDDDIGTFTGRRTLYRGRDPRAGAIIIEAVLLILIAGELIAVAPVLLVPFRLDQASAFDAVAHAEIGRVTGEQPADVRVGDPDPGGPKRGR